MPLERIVARHLERRVGATELLECDEDRGTIQQLLDPIPTLSARQWLGGRAVECQPCERARRINARLRRACDARRAELGEIQADATRCLRSDDRDIRAEAVDDGD